MEIYNQKLEFTARKEGLKQLGRPINLLTNCFNFTLEENRKLGLYAVEFHPNIEAGNRVAMRFVIQSVQEELTEMIGNYIFWGKNIFATKESDAFVLDRISKSSRSNTLAIS